MLVRGKQVHVCLGLAGTCLFGANNDMLIGLNKDMFIGVKQGYVDKG